MGVVTVGSPVVCEWKGSEDPDVHSGIATFQVDDFKVRVPLESFADFRALESIIERGCRVTEELASNLVRNRVFTALGRV